MIYIFRFMDASPISFSAEPPKKERRVDPASGKLGRCFGILKEVLREQI